MNRIFKSIVLAGATAATVMLPIMEASAGDRRWRDHHRPRHHHHYVKKDNNTGEMIAAGVVGLAVGALVAGAAANAGNAQPVYRERSYYPPAPRPAYRQPTVVYADRGYGFEPWSREWYRYCENRYRSFNPSTGTFRGYDGRDHFCVAR